MAVIDRYSTAINSSNLKSRPETTWSDSDVLGAMGIAGKRHPLGAALLRLFVDGKVSECAALMAEMVRVRSHKTKGQALTHAEARLLAHRVLAWYRFGTCSDCSGTGKEVIFEPKPHLSEEDCLSCHGTGRRLFEVNFSVKEMTLACWLLDEVAKQQAIAGNAAMHAIAPMLDF